MSYPYDHEPYVEHSRYDGLLLLGLCAISGAFLALAVIGFYTVLGWVTG